MRPSNPYYYQYIVPRSSAPPPFDPSTLDLSDWHGPNFGLPWAGIPSAGISGTYSEVGGAPPPISGRVLNSLISTRYQGATHVSTPVPGSPARIANTGYTIAALVYIESAAAPDALSYGNYNVYWEYFGFGFSFSVTTAGVQIEHYNAIDGSTFPKRTVACSTGAWHLIFVRYDAAVAGGTLDIIINGVTTSFTGFPKPTVGNPQGTGMSVYTNPPSTSDFDLMERMVSTSIFDNTVLGNITEYFNSKFGTSYPSP